MTPTPERSMSTLDDIRADIVARLERAQKCAEAAKQDLRTTYEQVSLFEAELRAHDRAVAAMLPAASSSEPSPAKRQRHDVRGIVLHILGMVEGEGWMEESHLGRCIAADGVNAEALHSYLLRSVRSGEVERDGKRNRYRLPQRPSLTVDIPPVPGSPERDAAE